MAIPTVSLALLADAPHWKEILSEFSHPRFLLDVEAVSLSAWSYRRDLMERVHGVLTVVRDGALFPALERLWELEFPVARRAFLVVCVPETATLPDVFSSDPRVMVMHLPLSVQMLERRLVWLFERFVLVNEVSFGAARLILAERVVAQGQMRVAVTEREIALLLYLAEHFPRPVPRAELLEMVFGYHAQAESHTVETHIYRLRQKLEALGMGECVVTREGGYVLPIVARVSASS